MLDAHTQTPELEEDLPVTDPLRELLLRRLGERGYEHGRLESLVRFDEPLAPHTTLRIGGAAEIFVEPDDEAALGAAMAVLADLEIPLRVLGAGSNLLISDRGATGAVLHLGRGFAGLTELEVGEDRVRLEVGASFRLVALARRAAERGWSGLEWAGGIPSSVGGAVTMNAGAHGGEMAQVIERARIVDARGRALELERDQLAFGYRHTQLPAGAVVTAAILSLEPGDADEIRTKMRSHLDRRKSTQPLTQPSAGSVFVNPEGDSAGRLIEAVGLKGHAIGGAAFSTMHANFIVNHGAATARDVIALVALARERVQAQMGHRLVPEIRAFGDFEGGAPW